MKPILKPALHTLWQSLAAGLATWFASANLGQVHGIDDAKKLALSGVAAAGAALLSGVYHAAKLYGPAAVNRVLAGRVNKAELFLIDQALDAALNAVPAPQVEQHITVNYPAPAAPDAHGAD